jgi:hypothetical protein
VSVATVVFSIILLACAVIVGTVIYAIVGGMVVGLASLLRRSDPERPSRELPAFSAETLWKDMQGTGRSSTASKSLHRRSFSRTPRT